MTDPTPIVRGATVRFQTTFYDFDMNVVQPAAATVNITYTNPDGTDGNASIAMTPPTAPAVAWTALWDTRDIGPGEASWSIHSDPGIPFAVEDGTIVFRANAANLVTFA